MQSIRKILSVTLLFAFVVGVAACDVLVDNADDAVKASGVVEAVEVVVSPELGGRVAEVLVAEGDEVQLGDTLFRLKDGLLDAQRKQAVAALEAAQANMESAHAALEAAEAAMGPANAAVEVANAAVDTANAAVEAANAGLQTAQAGVEIAAVQYQMEMVAARIADKPNRATAWEQDLPNEFTMPPWYFQKPETLEAAEAEIDSALELLEIEMANFKAVIEDASHDDLWEAEARLARAQVAFLVVEELQNRKIDQKEKKPIDDYIQSIYDAAESELETAQLDYEQMLSDQAATDVMEARARLAAAKERYEIAVDQLNALLTGEESLTLRAAEAVHWQAETYVGQAEAQVAQAEANVAQIKANVEQAVANIAQVEANIAQAGTGILQAEKVVTQAQAAIDLVEVQMEKLTVRAAVSGVVMTRNVEPGEVIQPGAVAMTIGQLDELTVTVYIPEDRYGQINLKGHARVSVDSFPGEVFDAVVIRIADRAEYTPRNVQTEEDRRTTVFAIKLSVEDSAGKLKPGMPADVDFGE